MHGPEVFIDHLTNAVTGIAGKQQSQRVQRDQVSSAVQSSAMKTHGKWLRMDLDAGLDDLALYIDDRTAEDFSARMEIGV